MRKNGWQVPFHSLQLATWVFFPVIVALFFAFTTPLLQVSGAYIGSIAYGITAIVVVVSVVLCTGMDPSDDSITRGSRASSIANALPPREDQVYCNVCQHYVHKESRHCRLCDKCVEIFDHHCKWLNNCVGKKNYHYFLSSVVASTLLLAIQVALGIFIFSSSYSNTDAIKMRSATAFGCSDGKETSGLCQNDGYHVSILAIRVIHGVLFSILGPWCFLIAQLAFFHFQLCIENITTYDYIVRQRKRKLQRERENALRPSGWRRWLVCCQSKQPINDKTTNSGGSEGNNYASESASRMSLQSEAEEQAAIEAEVDEDLEVLSARDSGEGNDSRGSSMYISSARQGGKRGSAPSRGFGLHVNLDRNANGSELEREREHGSWANVSNDSASNLSHTPIVGDDISYLAAPTTPRSPRSDADSAYRSDMSSEDERPGGLSASTVMYGRPQPSNPTENHIV